MTRFYFIRHGQSIYNAQGRIQGQQDVPLSDLGIRQGEAVAAALGDVPLDAVYSSPLTRARQTAEVLAASHRLPIRIDDRLKEIHAGIFQGRSRAELAMDHPEELKAWFSEDIDFVIPGGESRRHLRDRGREAILSIARQGHQHVAVVAHGRLLIVTLKHLLGIQPTEEPKALQNGSITEIDITPGCNGHVAIDLVALDRVDHLADVGLAGSGDL